MERWTIYWITGFLEIKICGDYVERFINMCRAHGILLWQIKKQDKDYLCRISSADFFELPRLIKKSKARVHVLSKHGLIFWIPFFRKRVLFFIGIILCLFSLCHMSCYIWAIEYVGNVMISDDELTDFIKQEKIYYGMKKELLDCEETEKKLRQQFECVTWTSIYFQGTKLYIEVKENVLQEYQAPKTQGTNIIASEVGTVESIITRNGVPKVKKGDVVEIGQILVDGSVPIYDESSTIVAHQFYKSDADIQLRTVQNYREEISKTGYLIMYDFETNKRHFVTIGDMSLEIPFFMQKGKAYEIICEKKQCRLFQQIYLPCFYGSKLYRTYHLTYFEYTNEELERILFDNFEKYILCLQEKGVQIIEKNVKINKNSNSMELVADILVIKETGETVTISMTE